MTSTTHLGNTIKHAMGNFCKALLCMACVTALAGHARAQENPASPGNANPDWIPYNGKIENIDPGKYDIIFREVDTECLSNTETFEINLLEKPAAPVVQEIIQPTCVLHTGSVVLSALPEGNWIINPGNISGSGQTTTITDLVAGQSYAFTVTTSDECTSEPSVLVPINPAPFTPEPPSAEAQTLCAGSRVENLIEQYPSGTELRWYTTDQGGSALASGTELETNTYYAAAVSIDGCESTRVAVSVFVNPIVPPTVSITANKTEICDGDEVIFTAEVSENVTAVNYQWLLNDEPTGDNSSTFTSATLNNDDKIRCSVSVTGTCVSETPVLSDVYTVSVSEKITVVAKDDTQCGDLIGSFTALGLDPNKQYEYQLIPKSQAGKPVITLLGDNPLYWTLGETFVDPGATAYDGKDGDITSDIVAVSTVDVNNEGTYQVTYNVTDSDGNVADEVVRVVNVAKYVMIMETSSIDNFWTPFNILNNGETLKWEVTGVVNYTVYANRPVFDFSILGQKKIIVTSSDRGSGITSISLPRLGLQKLLLFSGLTSLQGLDCSQNQLAFLDVSHLKSITYLGCCSNQLTSLDISNLNLLRNLNCGDNQLTFLDISDLPKLNSLMCYNNSLTSLSFNEAISSMSQLVCFNNKLSELPFPPNLESILDLNCSNNKIAHLDLSGIDFLKYVDCSKNILTELVVPVVFDDLKCQQNNLTSLILPADLISARTVDCSYNQLTSLALPTVLTSIQSLACGNNQLTSLVLPVGLISIQSLSCFANQLTSLDLSHLIDLESLSCHNNHIKSLDVSHLTYLRGLSCYDNQLSSLNITGLSNLQTLSCYNNQLTTLNTSNLTNVERLHCYNNQITSLDLSSLVSIGELWCYNNPLVTLILSSLKSVDILLCNDTQITSLCLPSVSSLNRLVCSRTPITSLMLNDNLTSIGEIRCERTELRLLTFPSHLSSLRTLSLEQNKMISADLNVLLDQIITQGITGWSLSASGWLSDEKIWLCADPTRIEAVESLFTYVNVLSCTN